MSTIFTVFTAEDAENEEETRASLFSRRLTQRDTD